MSIAENTGVHYRVIVQWETIRFKTAIEGAFDVISLKRFKALVPYLKLKGAMRCVFELIPEESYFIPPCAFLLLLLP